jgi:hypothetical protein
LNILNCTLRGGDHYNAWDFSPKLVSECLNTMTTISVDFAFLIDRTEVIDWQSWVNENNLKNCRNLTDSEFYEK